MNPNDPNQAPNPPTDPSIAPSTQPVAPPTAPPIQPVIFAPSPDQPTQPVAPSPTPPTQPATPTPTPDNPQAYLNAIAAPAKPAPFLSGKMLIILASAVAALVLVVIIGIIANSGRQSTPSGAAALGNKLSDLQAILKYSQSNPLKDSNVVQVVEETNLILLSRQAELEKVYTLTDPNAKDTPAQPAVIQDLDDAKARGSLDSAYIAALRDQLLAVVNQLEIMYKSATTDAKKEVLKRAYDDFKELANRLPSNSS